MDLLPTPLPVVELRRRPFPVDEFNRKGEPAPSHYSKVLDEPALLNIDGQPGGLYMPLDEKFLGPIRTAVQKIEYQDTYRTAGLKTTSRVIGYQPRVALRRDFCTAAALARESPTEHAVLCSGAALVSSLYKAYFPEQYARQTELLKQRVKPGWALPDSVYTSGICNWNNQLRYHFDAGNFPGTWNAMLTFKKDIDGGALAVPELDVAFAVRDGTVTLFDAQGLMHGVTPFKKLSPRAHRYTIVYYALQGMCHCGTPVEELERIRTLKTLREARRRGPPPLE